MSANPTPLSHSRRSTAPAIVILGPHSLPLAYRLVAVFPEATLYGLAHRMTAAESIAVSPGQWVAFDQFGDTVRTLFQQRVPIIGVCAAGILIRTVAPLLTDKWQEPPVLAIAEDGSAVVPLLGGLQGVNDLARQIADALQVAPAITTTGDLRFRTPLLAPPIGYTLANPETAKSFLADGLAGATIQLLGSAPWLTNSQLPIAAQEPEERSPLSGNGTGPEFSRDHPPSSSRTIRVTPYRQSGSPTELVYHPRSVVVVLDRRDASAAPSPSGLDRAEMGAAIAAALDQTNIAPAAWAGLVTSDRQILDPVIADLAGHLDCPLRFLTTSHESTDPHSLSARVQSAIASESTAHPFELPESIPYRGELVVATEPIDGSLIGQARGKLAIVGTGPGGADWMSPEVTAVLRSATDWVGYKTYLNLVERLRLPHITCHESDNRVELDRARKALNLAAEGRSVVVISSGDPGIYAMAAAVFEVIEQEAVPAWEAIELQVCPGISAMQAAAAQVGAPLGHDFCVISLSDILKPWEAIEQRIAAAAQADLVIAFYNPVSSQRTWQLEQAKQVLLQWRAPETPIVLGRNLGRPQQQVTVKALQGLTIADADMRTVILIGSSQTRRIERSDGSTWVYTPRQYDKPVLGTGG